MQLVALNRLGLGSRPAYCLAAQLWFAAVDAAGGTVSGARRVAINRLIVDLQAAGIWPLLDRLWIHAAENATQALIDLKARATATAVNGPTFSPNKGYTTDGSASYLNLGLASNAAGINYSRDDASFGGWLLTAPTNTGGLDWGYDYGGYSMIQARYGATLYRWEINSGTNPSGTPASGGLSTGFFQSQRTGSSTSTLFRNGASTITSNAPSVALQAKNFGAGAYVAGGGTFSAGQYAASFIGASLAGKEVAFYNAMNAFMVAAQVTSYDADTLAWQAAVIAAGGSVSAARRDLVDALILSLKSSGVWSRLDRLWLHAAENSAQGLVDLKGASGATAVNAPTFTANRGFQGNGTTSYLNTNFNPGTAPSPNYTRNDAGYGYWEVSADSGSSAPIGNNNDKNRIVTGGTTPRAFEVNSATATNGVVVTTATGHFHAQRTGATAAALYRNGVSFNTSGETSQAVVSCNFHVHSSPSGTGSGTPGALSAAQVGASWIGASLSGYEAAFYSAMRIHMTAIGVP